MLAQFEEIAKKTKYRDFSDISYGMYTQLRTAALAVIDRVSGPESIYAKQANNLPVDERNMENNLRHIPLLAGIVTALRDDVSNGFLDTARELIHGELFGDFLEMADFLLSEGYKDAAAVMGGGVLETSSMLKSRPVDTGDQLHYCDAS